MRCGHCSGEKCEGLSGRDGFGDGVFGDGGMKKRARCGARFWEVFEARAPTYLAGVSAGAAGAVSAAGAAAGVSAAGAVAGVSAAGAAAGVSAAGAAGVSAAGAGVGVMVIGAGEAEPGVTVIGDGAGVVVASAGRAAGTAATGEVLGRSMVKLRASRALSMARTRLRTKKRTPR
jgi:hypothetical protein